MTTPPTDRKSVEALAGRLDTIVAHDWRESILALTSDTAAEARDTLLALLDRAEAAETSAKAREEMLLANNARILQERNELLARAEKAEKERPKSYYEMTPRELQNEQAKLNLAIQAVVLGDPAKSVSFPSPPTSKGKTE